MSIDNLAEGAVASNTASTAASVDYDIVDPDAMDQGTLDVLDAYFGDAPSAQAPVESEVIVEDIESDDSVDEETAADEAEETPTEDEEVEAEEDDSPQEPGELNVIDLSDLTDDDVFEFELHGKKVHWNQTELLNQLKRSESASQLSREAKEQLEVVQADKEFIEAERAKLTQQASLVNSISGNCKSYYSRTDSYRTVQ